METSPVVDWATTEAYFTWADAPTMLWLCLALTLVAVVAVIGQSLRHEKQSFGRAEGQE